jgi:PKD repeat protein
MKRLRLALFLPLVSLTLYILLPALFRPAPAAATAYPGALQIAGPVQLDVKITPPISAPGEILELSLTLVNLDQMTHTPEITLQLPPNLHLDMTRLPAGVTANLAAHRLDWLPVLAANGGRQQFSLPLRVEAADILNPEQRITAVLELNGSIREASTSIWIGIPPRIEGLTIPAQVAVGLPVQLQAEMVGPGPFSQSWQLGDGRRVDVNDPVIVYPAAGVYDVVLTAYNPLASDTARRQITVIPHPVAQFRLEDDTVGVGQSITFRNESGGQPPLSYRWEFGDGTISDAANPVHQYQAPGIYPVSLAIENSYGRSQTFGTIIVGEPPLADLLLPATAVTGLPVEGQAFGDQSVTGFLWDMGNGRSQEGAQIRYIYQQPGDYYVILTAFNAYGSAQVGRWLRVEQGIVSTFLPLVLKWEEGLLPAAEMNPLGIVLEPVDLEAPFVLEPLELPPSSSPAEQLFVYINEARRQFDLPALQYVYELSVAAQQHAADMAAYRYTGHMGSDGSFPAERLLWHGYGRAYAGEATAWGFEQARQAVEFWINSPGHRAILLNRFATDVGVASVVDYNAPNVWYWTAEFGNASGGAIPPALRLAGPATDLAALNTTILEFAWNWPLPLTGDQRFTVYLQGAGQAVALGSVSQPYHGTRYRLQTAVADLTPLTGELTWQVRLEDSTRNPLVEGERRAISVELDPNLPTPTPQVTPTTAVTPIVTPTPTATPTPGLVFPTPTPRPTELPRRSSSPQRPNPSSLVRQQTSKHFYGSISSSPGPTRSGAIIKQKKTPPSAARYSGTDPLALVRSGAGRDLHRCWNLPGYRQQLPLPPAAARGCFGTDCHRPDSPTQPNGNCHPYPGLADAAAYFYSGGHP